MEISDLIAWLERMAGAGVMTVGDVMIDHFIYGDVARISAEAPIPVLRRTRAAAMLGGCGNVARNIVSLGGRAALIGVVGADAAAGEIAGLIEAEPRMENHLVVDAERPTTIKSRFISGSQQLLRVDQEAEERVSGDIEAALARRILNGPRAVGAILLSDYGKGVVTPAVIQACHEAARARGAILVVDSKARAFGHYGPVDVIKPNAAELARATDLPTDTDAEIEAALEKALAMSEAGAVLATRAAKGMSLAVRGRPVIHASRPPAEVFDTSGAGDTALAALGLALAAGLSGEEAMRVALAASSIVVAKAGTATATPAEIKQLEAMAHPVALGAKIATVEAMRRKAEDWRAQGLKVGFTNGCFDILHSGHIAYLSQARGWCDRLIVGVNSDRSVRALKGEGRPVNGLDDRARVLAGLSAVDLVAPFDESTPIALIEAARPDLLVKGADYAADAVVGRDLVLSWGGEVRLAAFVDGHSTTATIDRLSKAN